MRVHIISASPYYFTFLIDDLLHLQRPRSASEQEMFRSQADNDDSFGNDQETSTIKEDEPF